jgi:hypothetical protein
MYRSGDVTINWVEGEEGEDTTIHNIQVGAALQLKMFSGGGTDETIFPRPFRIDSMNDRWAVYRSGDVTINWVEGDGGGRHNNSQHSYSYFSPKPI